MASQLPEVARESELTAENNDRADDLPEALPFNIGRQRQQLQSFRKNRQSLTASTMFIGLTAEST